MTKTIQRQGPDVPLRADLVHTPCAGPIADVGL